MRTGRVPGTVIEKDLFTLRKCRCERRLAVGIGNRALRIPGWRRAGILDPEVINPGGVEEFVLIVFLSHPKEPRFSSLSLSACMSGSSWSEWAAERLRASKYFRSA